MAVEVGTSNMIEAVPEDVGMSSVALGKVTRLVQGYIDAGKFPGAISMVARRGRVAHFETYGQMDAEAGKPMAPDTIFRMASMTKPIVSVALMTLYEEGRFQLETPIAEFIPAFKDVKVFASGTADSFDVRDPVRAMTVRDLLTHTSGLTAAGNASPVAQLYQRAGILTMGAVGTLADMTTALAKLPLDCDPGAEFNYGVSTNIVGHLCELISGKPLDVFLKDRVLEPLGMRDTGFHLPALERDRLAACYDQVNDGEVRYRRRDGSADTCYEDGATFFSGAGGLLSTANDYMRFAKMLAGGGTLAGVRVIGPRTLQFMAANHLPGGKEMAEMIPGRVSPTWIAGGTGFGLGFAVLLDPVRAGVLGTPGEYYWGGAYSTAYFVSPAEDLIMIFLTQLGGSDYAIRRQLRVATYQAIGD